jgi:hypothetical protein
MVKANYAIKGKDLQDFKKTFGRNSNAIRLFNHYDHLQKTLGNNIPNRYRIERQFLRICRGYLKVVDGRRGVPNRTEEFKEEIFETVKNSDDLAKLALEFTNVFPTDKLIKIAFKKV